MTWKIGLVAFIVIYSALRAIVGVVRWVRG